MTVAGQEQTIILGGFWVSCQWIRGSDMKPYATHRKSCSVCGVIFPIDEFTYGNRENRSYCKLCDAAVSKAYAKGGTAAARAFREEQRRKWKSA